MTIAAWCTQCTFNFPAHIPHPIVPAHINYGTDRICAGSGTVALTGVSR